MAAAPLPYASRDPLCPPGVWLLLSERPGTQLAREASVAFFGAVSSFEAGMEPEVVVDAEQQRKDQALAAFRAKLLQHKARGCALPAPCA